MPPIQGLMHLYSHAARYANLKTLSSALKKGLKTLDALISQSSKAALEPVLVRNAPKQPLHPLARIRQSQSRWYSTTRKSIDSSSFRNFTTSATGKSGAKYDRASFPKSTIGGYVQSSSGRAPFASTLRPNLTGGALGRTAGGYSSGGAGGARYFSHSPAAQAQVVQNVSQAVRAFFISGHKAQFDGVTQHGEKRFKAVSALQEETGRKMKDLPKATPGSWIDFSVNPTITALTSLNSVAGFSSETVRANHLNTDGLLDILSVDFSRALTDLAAVLNDLKRLSVLGDLPIMYEGSHLRVHFPGCDAESVEQLCDELNVQRGTVVQDEHFDAFAGTEIALLFPFAPSNGGSITEDSCYEADLFDEAKPLMAAQRYVISLDDMLSCTQSPAYSTQSDTGFEETLDEQKMRNPWMSSPSGYQSVQSGNIYGSDKHSPLEYQGFEGIYKFIEELDSVRR
ncbi:hypothetical protein DOTSEDRAFT_145033 [Dothistroma septosporum NZE10]|uniref:Casein kinase II beta 2 subunit n=1 Tax=Dothistroma septosporum (strain NZE10 / CBS 128990) TaxID=675120 RepID=N1Q596_DOTSN|nr:hypothetical protein DOTSEDRAFT_145033 [Dothistroma septosporum NZE10]